MRKLEQQKTELLGLLWSISAYVPDDTVDEIENRINKLQPERPTCATCKFSGNYAHPAVHLNFCQSGKVPESLQGEIVADDFGCINHSDYEKRQTNES